MGLRRATLVSLLATAVAASPVQVLGDELADCASVARSNVQSSPVSIICGMPREQLVELVKLAAPPAAGNRAALRVRLNAIVPANSRYPVEAVARFLEILHEQPIDDDRLADSFARIAQEHARLLEEIRAMRVPDPQVQTLHEAAAAALQGAPNHDLARAKLAEARTVVQAKRQAGAKAPADLQREEAGLVREQARVETARLRFAEAARLYEQAAQLLPAEDRDERGSDWLRAGLSWKDQGRTFDDNPALLKAIAALRSALEERTRERVPLDWATTQNNLGTALPTLGQRESGTARLEEAVAAYRAALRGADPRAGAARLGHDAEQSRHSRSGGSGSARAARRGWRRRSPPIAPRWRNGPASACRSTGPRRRTTSATRSATLGRARERHGAAGGGGRRLSRGAGGTDPRAGAARLGR